MGRQSKETEQAVRTPGKLSHFKQTQPYSKSISGRGRKQKPRRWSRSVGSPNKEGKNKHGEKQEQDGWAVLTIRPEPIQVANRYLPLADLHPADRPGQRGGKRGNEGGEGRDEWSVARCQQPLCEGPRVTGGKNDNARIVRRPAAQDWRQGRKEHGGRVTGNKRKKNRVGFFLKREY